MVPPFWKRQLTRESASRTESGDRAAQTAAFRWLRDGTRDFSFKQRAMFHLRLQ